MRISRAMTGAGVLGLLLAPVAQAAPACAAPLAVARALFQAGTSARFLDTPDALLAPGFARLIAAERDCQQREQGICRLDHDPWLDGQDGEVDAGPGYQWVAQSPAAGTVEVRFAVWGEPRLARLAMRRQADGCWRAEDLITDRGQSLRALLVRPFP
ncbi:MULTISPECIES: hypothetical protein [Stenotrophomonas]|uniref:hypothetical protein n=1 Tax=Stenotrophomonas TaxID=40323 RepID=UPI001F06B2A8|nr:MULTISPECIES: hypothetical protein [Stenotrophomonas]MCH1907508.1 hypothetical protein [Stenotrophomonas sp. Y6]